jgi:hypothetical protein
MLSVVLFVVGVIFGRVWFGFILLPLLYGVPKVTWQVWRGRLRPGAMIVYIFPVVLWSGIFTLVAVALAFVSRPTADFLRQSGAFAGGQFFGVAMGFLQMVSREGRQDLGGDFLEATARFKRHGIER